MLSWILGILGAVCIAIYGVGHLLGAATPGTSLYLAFAAAFLVGAIVSVLHDRRPGAGGRS